MFCWGVLFIVWISASVGLAQNEEENQDEQPTERFSTPCVTPNNDTALCLDMEKCHLLFNEHIDEKHPSYKFMQASNCAPKGKKPKICCGKYKNYITPCITPNNDSAICLDMEKCPLFLNERIDVSHPSYKFIQESNCASKGKKTKICCGKYKNYIASNPLPTDCGQHKITILGSRIFGGNEAALGEFPWMGRIIHRSTYGYNNYGCSAVLIHPRFALTAAHCVQSKNLVPLGPIHQIVFGKHDMDKEVDCSKDEPKYCSDPPVYIQTGKIQVYSGYDNRSQDHNNDIAIIALKNDVTFSAFIQPSCLLESIGTVKSMWIAGWGKTETEDSSNVKRKVEVPRVNTEKCFDRYSSIGVSLNKKNQICAGGDEGVDSCTGDSGGPLMVNINGRWYLEGIVSFGVSCGRKGWPGVYTNVPRYVDWIKATINRKLSNKQNKIQMRSG